MRLYSNVAPTQGQILDFGCGNGWFTLWLNTHRGKTIGVDAMIKNYLPMIPPALRDCFQEQLPSVENQAGCFQFITADNVLEHLEDPVGTLCHLNALLPVGGQLHALVPMDGLDPAWNTLAHCWKTTPPELESTLQSCGFSVSTSTLINTWEAHQWVLPSCRNLMHHGIFIKREKRSPEDPSLAVLRSTLKEHARANILRNPDTKEFKAGTIFNQGKALSAAGRHDEAIRCFKDAIHINPFYKNAYHEMAVSHTALGQWQMALIPLRILLETINADHAAARILLINVLRELKEPSENIDFHWQELERRNPDVMTRMKALT